MWAKIDEFLMPADPLKIIWNTRKNSIVSEILLYRVALYQGWGVQWAPIKPRSVGSRDQNRGLCGPWLNLTLVLPVYPYYRSY